MPDHRIIDERSLAFGRAIAARLAEDPSLIERARANLKRWMPTASPSVKPDLAAWAAALDGPIERVIQLLTRDDDERSVRLRQSNPFAGVLCEQERLSILKRFGQQPHDPATA
jgi:hypothetical protein